MHKTFCCYFLHSPQHFNSEQLNPFWKLLSSVWLMFTNVSEKHTASILRVKQMAKQASRHAIACSNQSKPSIIQGGMNTGWNGNPLRTNRSNKKNERIKDLAKDIQDGAISSSKTLVKFYQTTWWHPRRQYSSVTTAKTSTLMLIPVLLILFLQNCISGQIVRK
jgi:hypothetical protein